MAADNGSAQSTTIWPLPSHYFKVTMGTVTDPLTGSFAEVTGLSSEAQVIEYRHSGSPNFWTIKMPGMFKAGNVTLKRGHFKSDNTFYNWHGSILMNTIQRQNVVIALLDEKGDTTMQWTLVNAIPVKIIGPDLKSDANLAAMHTLELAHEKLTVLSK